jgi:hypothetical protein
MISSEQFTGIFRLTEDGKLERLNCSKSRAGNGWSLVEPLSRDKDGYVRVHCRRTKQQHFRRSHIVYCLAYGDIPDGLVVDHIDRNRENDHPSNLRLVTPRENNENSDVYKNGVLYRNNRWTATITIRKRKVNLGAWMEEEHALAASKLAKDLVTAIKWSSPKHLTKVVIESISNRYGVSIRTRRLF